MAGTAGEEFCSAHADKVADLVAFLANAKLLRTAYNKTRTRMVLGLRRGDKKVAVQVPIVDRHPKYNCFEAGDWKEDLLLAALQAFGLSWEWKNFKQRQSSWMSNSNLLEELRRRGGKRAFDLVDDQVMEQLQSGKPQKVRDERKRAGELNRALACLRKARKLGATPRQMKGLVNHILAEEAVAEVQND